MNIHQAIEILTDLAHPAEFTLSPDIKDAVELGIQALIIVNKIRNQTPVRIMDAMEGETM